MEISQLYLLLTLLMSKVTSHDYFCDNSILGEYCYGQECSSNNACFDKCCHNRECVDISELKTCNNGNYEILWWEILIICLLAILLLMFVAFVVIFCINRFRNK